MTTEGELQQDSIAFSGAGWFLLFLVASAGVAVVGSGRSSEPPLQQPVVFNHQRHVEGEGLDCTVCHENCRTQPKAGLPSARTCALCHAEPQGESAEERKLVALLAQNADLEWQRIFRQPPHVFFSHRRHVTVVGLPCETCHGDIAQSTEPPRERRPLKMDECVACHEQKAVTIDCTACHR